MKAALYARVSTERQKDEKTIEAQIAEIKRTIEEDGHTIDEANVYSDDGWSGGYLERPGLDALRQDARQNKFSVVYAYDKGRIARKYVYQEVVIDELRRNRISFKSLKDINGETDEERVMGSVMGIFHEYERVKIAERFRIGKLNKVRNGKLLGYNPPYGYQYIPVTGKGLDKVNGHFEVDPIEADVVRKIYKWVGEEKISLREVIRRLQQQNIAPRKGKRETWTKGPVYRLLTNETYVGRHYYNKSESCLPKNPKKEREYIQHTDKTSRKKRDKSEWLMVEVPPIISEKLFEKVQKQIALNAKYASRNTKHEYLLGGLIYCTCGSHRSSDTARGHYYYRCTDRLHQFPNPPKCTEKGINVRHLDAVTWEKIVILLTEPKLIDEQYKRYRRESTNSKVIDTDISSIEKELSKLKDEEQRYIAAYGRGILDEALFDSSMNTVRVKKQALLNQKAEAVAISDKVIPEINADELAKKFTQLVDNLEFRDKLSITRKLIDKVIATKEEVTICGNIPLTPTKEEKAAYESIYRHRRPPECWQVYSL